MHNKLYHVFMQPSEQEKKRIFTQALGRVAARLKNESGRSAIAVAYEISLSKTTLLLTENGELDPRLTTFCRIAEALYIKPEKLLNMIYEELPENWSFIE